jgi:hypothetical protein
VASFSRRLFSSLLAMASSGSTIHLFKVSLNARAVASRLRSLFETSYGPLADQGGCPCFHLSLLDQQWQMHCHFLLFCFSYVVLPKQNPYYTSIEWTNINKDGNDIFHG